MTTKTLFAIAIGICGLYVGQTLGGIIGIVATIIGFISVMIGCVLSFKRLIDKQNR